MPTRAEIRFDRVLAAVLFVCALLSLALYQQMGIFANPAPLWVGVVTSLCLCGTLAWRRSYPVLVMFTAGTIFVVAALLGVAEQLLANVVLFLSIYTVGAVVENRDRARLMRMLMIAGMFVFLVVGMFIQSTSTHLVSGIPQVGALSPLVAFMLAQILINVLYFAGAYMMGEIAYRVRLRERQLRALTTELELERARGARQAVALERVRIARELHDVVAHHVSLMGVQAGAARIVLDRDPDAARTALHQVETSARLAISELRGLLGTLREADPSLEDAPSTVSLSGLPALIHASEDAGLPTRFEIQGTEVPVSSLTGFTLFRVAQESLTNARKHGGQAATADVRLRYLSDGVELEIANTGAMPIPHPQSGHGQLGMRERIAAVEGRLEYGPRTRGGYLVRAFVPYDLTALPEGVTR
ncbi:sensor histidine kinase [Mycetocola saprophilus]|uniref:sensor histidine kinase n=1 Tax=Mycetocola saprophilus TaxID=76636 RepID=UPI003BF33C5C